MFNLCLFVCKLYYVVASKQLDGFLDARLLDVKEA